MELASFMSCSKGFMGECGLRGGYLELINVDPGIRDIFIKSISAKLCSSVLGQAAMECVVNPPRLNEPSFEQFEAEKQAVLIALRKKAELAAELFNDIDGIRCNPIEGAMYCFPSVDLPEKAVELAKSKGLAPDAFYCFEMLEKIGLCVVPGSGFGQQPGTHHFRMTILPPLDDLHAVLKRVKNFHSDFLRQVASS